MLARVPGTEGFSAESKNMGLTSWTGCTQNARVHFLVFPATGGSACGTTWQKRRTKALKSPFRGLRMPRIFSWPPCCMNQPSERSAANSFLVVRNPITIRYRSISFYVIGERRYHMTERDSMTISSSRIDVWPQGKPAEIDDLRPDGGFGYLNEQVLWIRHSDMKDSRSALRVPETVKWEGKEEAKEPAQYYQVGQCWRHSGDKLLFEKCSISCSSGRSPGVIASAVEIVEDEILRVEIAIGNKADAALKQTECHFCLNHRRAPLLGRRLSAYSSNNWVDFHKYRSPDRAGWLFYHFTDGHNDDELPSITAPILFSETVCETGVLTSAIGASWAKYICSNTIWPCTDICIDFATINPGQSCSRELFVGLGLLSKDDLLERISAHFRENKEGRRQWNI